MKLTKALNIVWGIAFDEGESFVNKFYDVGMSVNHDEMREALRVMHIHCVTLPDHEDEYGYSKTRRIEEFEQAPYKEDEADDKIRRQNN